VFVIRVVQTGDLFQKVDRVRLPVSHTFLRIHHLGGIGVGNLHCWSPVQPH